jgi:esterase/lipase superfamily enzyme
MYYKMGFNILLVDQRSHGKSEGKYITFGVNESRDVLSWLEFVNTKFSPEKVIISGISMGATTVLMSLRFNLPQNVKSVIADCGFTSPVEIIAKVGKDNYKINTKPIIPLLDLTCRIIGKFSITNINTVDIVKNTEDTRDGRSKIYKLSDLSTMKKTDTSEPVWVLAQVKNIAVNLKTKTGKTFSKVIINDGETSLTLFIWQDHLPSFFNKGNVIILPLRVVTDEDTEENKITFASWKADKVDIPILEYGE